MQAARAKQDSLRRPVKETRVGIAVLKWVTIQTPGCKQNSEHRSTSDVLAAVDVPCGALEPTRSLPLSYAECRCRLPCREQGQ